MTWIIFDLSPNLFLYITKIITSLLYILLSSAQSNTSYKSFAGQNEGEQMSLLMQDFKYFVMMEEQEFPKIKDKKHNFAPTTEELEDVIQALKDKYPDLDTFKIIRQLYSNLVPRNLHRIRRKIPNGLMGNEEVRQKLYEKSPFYKIEKNISTIQNLQQYVGFQKVYLKSSWQPEQFTSRDSEMRFFLRRIAAKSLAQRQHSIEDFRQEMFQNGLDPIRHKIDGEQYKTILQSVVIEAYRFLENFIMTECKIGILPLARHEIRVICARLFRCRESLKQDEREVFLSILKIKYGLEDVTLDEYFAIKLYWTTQKGLRVILLRRMNQSQTKSGTSAEQTNVSQNCDDTKSIIFEKTVKSHAISGIKNLWSLKLEKQFIQQYKKNQFFLRIKEYFIKKYPQNRQLFQGNTLKNRLFQILRASMKKVRQIVEKCHVKEPQLVKLNDDRIKYILKSSRALKARLMLVDIYLDTCMTFTSKIEAMIIELNEAIQDRNPNRSACSYSTFGESQQLTPSEIQASRKERRKQRRLELIKEKKARQKKYEGISKEPIVKFEAQPLYYDQYNKYMKNGDAAQKLRQQLSKPGNEHYKMISKRLEEDPEKYERFMEDEESEYPSQFFIHQE